MIIIYIYIILKIVYKIYIKCKEAISLLLENKNMKNMYFSP